MQILNNTTGRRADKIEESCKLPEEFKAFIRLLARNAALEFLSTYRHDKHNRL